MKSCIPGDFNSQLLSSPPEPTLTASKDLDLQYILKLVCILEGLVCVFVDRDDMNIRGPECTQR